MQMTDDLRSTLY